MTCNPNWKEILENLLEGQTPADRPDLVARVFKQKKDYLINLISKEGYFGKCKAYVYTIEFQKRGLPHAHILVTLEGDYKMRTAEVINRYISAQLPDPELYPRLHELVVKHMIHGPCGARCMKDGKCSKHFPHEFQEETSLDEDGYPSYARPNNGITVTKSSGFVVDNRYVVPHCPNLLLELNCHINVEVVSSIKAVKYLYKYIFKGHDSAAMKIVDGSVVYDECESFLDSRYMGSAEACWRILGYELHGQSHSISRLPLHLPGEQRVSFVDAENEDELKAAMEKMSMLMEYFELNSRDPKAREFYYHEIPEKYTWKKITQPGQAPKMQWSERKSHFNVIGRMYSVSPTNQELFHLRILLNHVKGATSFEDLKRVEGQQDPCQTFTQTCLELGLVKDDKEWEKVLNEAKLSLMPYQMRMLFVRLLIHCSPLAPHDLWETFKSDMSDDFARHMSEERAIKKGYREIQRILEIENKSLTDFPSMPQNVDFDGDYDIYDPIFDQEIGDQMFNTMNDAQKEVIKKVQDASSGESNQKLFYLDGPGGSDSNSTITPNSKQGKKLLETDVFIWDEAPMAPKYALEIMDRLLRDLTKIDEPFGGKILLLGGDFRQLLPVRKNGTRAECS
uniref:ATP-dependent DNA helicase n=1 Tax=Panagrolaimus superbus TaxID=310955 RepID=A0A914YYL5_9BILA